MAAAGQTPLTKIATGLGAGVIGTLAMTGWQELSSRLLSHRDGDGDGEADEPSWEDAPVPAQVARRLANAAGADPSPKRIPLLTNVMHWSYGTGWGVVYPLLPRRALTGVLFGTGVWAMSYVQLVPLGLYEPPWKYSPAQLALDLSYHLVYGVGTQVGDAVIARTTST